MEQSLRETEVHAPLGDHQLAAQRSLQAPAQGVAFQHRDGHDRRVEPVIIVVDRVDAGIGVSPEPLLVPRPHTVKKIGQVAAHVEHAGAQRAADEETDGRLSEGPALVQGANVGGKGVEFAQQRQGPADAVGVAHRAPHRFSGRIETNVEFATRLDQKGQPERQRLVGFGGACLPRLGRG
jgi:hypothetical protein